MVNTVTTSIAGKQITIETGRLAKQTDGSVLVTSGNNMVLVTVVSNKTAKPDQGFFPLTVEYIEKFYDTNRRHRHLDNLNIFEYLKLLSEN